MRLSHHLIWNLIGLQSADPPLLGSLIRGNKKGLAVADIATQDDLDELSSFGDVVILESGVNAAGNLIECNDKGP